MKILKNGKSKLLIFIVFLIMAVSAVTAVNLSKNDTEPKKSRSALDYPLPDDMIAR
jgi:flagellar basal body-associated protein FliL